MQITVDGEPVGQFVRDDMGCDFPIWSPSIQTAECSNWTRIWAPGGRVAYLVFTTICPLERRQ